VVTCHDSRRDHRAGSRCGDIVGIIGEYVLSQENRRRLPRSVPFHRELAQLLGVTAKRMYHCFVCNESGDVFKFLTKRLGVDWPEAVRIVGEKVGIEVRDTKTRSEGPDPREPFWELNATAAAYFRQLLWDESCRSACPRLSGGARPLAGCRRRVRTRIRTARDRSDANVHEYAGVRRRSPARGGPSHSV
jgi:hypothetical protein